MLTTLIKKKAEVTILISDKLNIRTMEIVRNKKSDIL